MRLHNFITYIKKSDYALFFGIILFLISTLITFTDGIGIMKKIYSHTSYSEKIKLLENIASLSPDANIDYFKEKLGKPIFIKMMDDNNIEFIFYNKYSIIQVVTDNKETTLAYSVTSLKEGFNPEITLPTMSQGQEEVKIKLGKTKFIDLNELPSSPSVQSWVGAHDYYYGERYYFGNPGFYLTYIFSSNHMAGGSIPNFDLNNDVEKDAYRWGAEITTYTVISGNNKAQELKLDEWGGSINDVRVIPGFYD